MRRLTITLFIIILLIVLSPCLSSLAQSGHIPHENPATAEESPDLLLVLLFYGSLFDRVAIGEYRDAESMLDELEYANIPVELRYIIDRYNALSRELFVTLGNLESLLDEASSLLSDYQISGAGKKLDEAELAIGRVWLLVEDIEEATVTLGDKFGVFAASAGSPITQAYERLEGILKRLRQIIDELNKLRLSLTKTHSIEAQKELISTELSLRVTPISVFVGDIITASGRLTDDGNPLAYRKLTLLLDNEPLTINTDLSGAYSVNLTIPYNYVHTTTLQALYNPYGSDIGTYLASCSPTVSVNTSFYSTALGASVPERVYPGLPITISGEISSTGDNIDRSLMILLDNNQIALERVQGQFNIDITPSPQLLDGEHTLKLDVASCKRYAGASKSLKINISRIPIEMDIQAPSLVVTLKPFNIWGRVYHGLEPLQGAEVHLSFGRSTTTARTSTDGSFTAIVDIPFDLSLAAPQELTIAVRPLEPWYASCQIKIWVFSINPANLGVMLIIFLSLGTIVYGRVRGRPKRELPPLETKLREQAAPSQPVRLKCRFTGIKRSILSAYLSGLESVEHATGIHAAPHITLSEFLRAALPRMSAAVEPFTELTELAEITLYSASELDENKAVRAGRLAAIIKKELESGDA